MDAEKVGRTGETRLLEDGVVVEHGVGKIGGAGELHARKMRLGLEDAAREVAVADDRGAVEIAGGQDAAATAQRPADPRAGRVDIERGRLARCRIEAKITAHPRLAEDQVQAAARMCRVGDGGQNQGSQHRA